MQRQTERENSIMPGCGPPWARAGLPHCHLHDSTWPSTRVWKQRRAKMLSHLTEKERGQKIGLTAYSPEVDDSRGGT